MEEKEGRKGGRETKGEKKDVSQINHIPYARCTTNFAPGNFISTLTFRLDHPKQGPTKKDATTHP